MTNLPKWAKWIARDRDELLHVYEEEPEKDEDDEEWVYTENFGRYERVHETSDVVYASKEVKWEDERACEIAPKPYRWIELTIDSEKMSETMMANLRTRLEELAGIKSSDKPEEEPDDSNSGIYTTVTDNVNHPQHYKQGEIEALDVIRMSLSPEEYRGFLKGNVLKYQLRAPYKHEDPEEDHQKAKFYYDKLKGHDYEF